MVSSTHSSDPDFLIFYKGCADHGFPFFALKVALRRAFRHALLDEDLRLAAHTVQRVCVGREDIRVKSVTFCKLLLALN